jgi:hypothetical protein
MTTARPRQATADDLLLKPARTQKQPLTIPDDKGAGGTRQVEITMTSISAHEYDDLMAEHPPTKAQKEEGSSYNPDTFAPALIAAVVSEPKLTIEQATEIWNSKTWSRGELRDLFIGCVNLCSRGLDLPFTPGV